MLSRPPKIALFDTKPYDRQYFSSANTNYNFDITYFEPRITEDTVKLAEGFDAVCLFVHDAVNHNIALKLHEMGIKIVALRSNGYNHIDIKTLQNANIPVVRVPRYSPYAIAEYTIGLMLALNRKIHLSYWRTKNNNFSLQGLMGFDMRNKTVGVIGAGQIGGIVVQLLHAFQCRILIYDPFLPQDQRRKLEETTSAIFVSEQKKLFEEADIITLHCQLTPENRYCINKTTLASMKPGVSIINTSRGGLIDTESLIDSLKSGHVSACALDVYEEEDRYFFEDFSSTFIDDDLLARLLTFPNVIISSHQAFFTKEAMHEIAETTLKNIDSFFSQQRLENQVLLN